MVVTVLTVVVKTIMFSGVDVCLISDRLQLRIVRSWVTFVGLTCCSVLASEYTTNLLELAQALGGKSRHAVVLRWGSVNLMNRLSGVNDLGLNGLLVDDRDDILVDVVVDMLSGLDWGLGTGLSDWGSDRGVPELTSFFCQSSFSGLTIAMLELLLLHGQSLVGVLLWEDLLICNWLDSGVVVVLMSLAVNSCRDLLMSSRLYLLLSDGWLYLLVNLGGVTMLVKETANCLSCAFHVCCIGSE